MSTKRPAVNRLVKYITAYLTSGQPLALLGRRTLNDLICSRHIVGGEGAGSRLQNSMCKWAVKKIYIK